MAAASSCRTRFPPKRAFGLIGMRERAERWAANCAWRVNPERNRGGSEGAIAMNDKIRILVAEDHLVARVGVSTIVNMQPDMTCGRGLQRPSGRRVVPQAPAGCNAPRHAHAGMEEWKRPPPSGRSSPRQDDRLTTYGGDEDIRRALAAGAGVLDQDVLHDEY